MMISIVLSLVLILSVVTGASADDTGDPIVHLSKPLEFADGLVEGDLTHGKAVALISRPVMTGRSADEGLVLTGPGDTKQVVATCSEYLDLTSRGWYAFSTFDMIRESNFTRLCGTARLVSRACATNRSFIEDFRLSNLSSLPTTLLPKLTDYDAEAIKLLEKNGHAISDVIDVRSKTISEDGLYVSYEYEGMQQYIEEIARGDFDCDGVKDVLVLVTDRAIGGSYRAYMQYVLTRHSPDAKLHYVSVNDCYDQSRQSCFSHVGEEP